MSSRHRVAILLAAILFVSFPAYSENHLHTWREIWRDWSWAEKARYLEGYQSAWQTAIIRTHSLEERIASPRLGDIQGQYALAAGQFVELVDHFYSDPANDLVNFDTAIELSVARFRGEDIGERLRGARKHGLLLRE